MRGIAVAMIVLSCSGQLHRFNNSLRENVVDHLQVPGRRWQDTACPRLVKSQLPLVNILCLRGYEEANVWRPRR
jgi:hypothetical protein